VLKRVICGQNLSYQPVEVPFAYRHLCWFCGEPANKEFAFPQADNPVLQASVQPLVLMACSECYQIAVKSHSQTIWQCRHQVKKWLMRHYHKDLAIGVNWTQEELASAGFEGGNFEGFARSAWQMFEIARQRVNYPSWPLVVAGIELQACEGSNEFLFDGICYPSLNDAISHYCQSFHLDRKFFIEVLSVLGEPQFAKVVRFCRLLVNHTPAERQLALAELVEELQA
jgi:hypothetical protein